MKKRSRHFFSTDDVIGAKLWPVTVTWVLCLQSKKSYFLLFCAEVWRWVRWALISLNLDDCLQAQNGRMFSQNTVAEVMRMPNFDSNRRSVVWKCLQDTKSLFSNNG